MDKKKIDNAIEHIRILQERLCYCDNNLQYIMRIKAIKYWLDKFDSLLDKEQGEYSAIYESYFLTCCGFSFYERVCNSIISYQYGDKPF